MPVSVRGLSPRVQDLHNRVKAFIKEYIVPFEAEYTAHSLSSKRWEVMPKQEELKVLFVFIQLLRKSFDFIKFVYLGRDG